MRTQTQKIAILLGIPLLLGAAQDRVAEPIDVGRTAVIGGHVHPKTRLLKDAGPMNPSTPLEVSILMKPLPALDALLAAQQDRRSPNFRKWITPEQFADQFGLSRGDFERIANWLRSQGLEVHDAARGRHWINVAGSATNLSRALHTEFHHFIENGKYHFANVSEPSVPAELNGVVAGFLGLNDFETPRTVPRVTAAETPRAAASSQTLSPDDFAAIYNVAPLYAQGIDGFGQTIAVIGAGPLDLSDVQSFRQKYNLPSSEVQVVPVGSASTTLDFGGTVNVEWAGAVARRARIIYLYAALPTAALQYAIDQNLAPVVAYPYGGCERWWSPSLRYLVQQANAQGITIVGTSGYWGSATCDDASPSPAAAGVAVSFPGSIPEVTAVGGTMFNEGDSAYWTGNSSDAASAVGYIPERVHNEAAVVSGLFASGGGPSVFFAKPAWQNGPGVPNDNARDLPDVSLTASPFHDGYSVVYGGKFTTSYAQAPAFAGIVALINHYLAVPDPPAQLGLGNINPNLYRLAQTAPAAFHDITEGDNKLPCMQGSPGCVDSQIGFAAGPGYDLATGLGSVDVYNLATLWDAGVLSTTRLTVDPSTAGPGDQVQLTATVSGAVIPGYGHFSEAPRGKVTFLSNGNVLGIVDLTAWTEESTATLSVTGAQLAADGGKVTAYYSGDSLYNSSGDSAVVGIKLPTSGSLMVPSMSPNPVYQSMNCGRAGWCFTITLSELAGVDTTLTGYTAGGVVQNGNIIPFFGTNRIPAHGKISANLVITTLATPVNRDFVFTGRDANGVQWSAQLTVPFLPAAGPLLPPVISLTGAPAVVRRNPQADPSCFWQQELTVEEKAGYFVELSAFTIDGAAASSQIPQMFGTTRLAPWGILQGSICLDGSKAIRTLVLSGTNENGYPLAVTYVSSLAGPASETSAMTAVPDVLSIAVTKESPNGSATLSLQFEGGAPSWNIAVVPSNSTTSWLTVSPISGAGSAQIALNASSAGLSNGVYRAVLVIQSPGAQPQFMNVPVVFAVGAASATAITAMAGTLTGDSNFTPGMLVDISGSNLAPMSKDAADSGQSFAMAREGVAVTVNGIPAPLTRVSPDRLTAQIPFAAGAGPAVLGVNNNGAVAWRMFTVSAAPGAFETPKPLRPATAAISGSQFTQEPSGADVVRGPSRITAGRGVSPGEWIHLWLPAVALNDSVEFSGIVPPVSIRIGDYLAEMLWPAPPTHGVYEITVKVPDLPDGEYPVIMEGGQDLPGAALHNIGRLRIQR